MKPITVQVTYRMGRPFAAYIVLDRRPSDAISRTEEVSADLLVDYAEDGRALGIEVVTPKAVTIDDILAVFDQLGLGRPAKEELAPLRAA